MTPGEKMPDTIFRALKPAALDELAEEGHARRRDSDLARVMSAAEPRPRRRTRRPVLLVAGLAAAACAAAGAVVVTGGDGTSPQPPAVQQGPTDARTFLLASATTAAKAPATTGRYWYTRELTTRSYSKEVRDFLLKAKEQARHEYAGHKYAGKARKGGGEGLPSYAYRVTTGQESWLSRTGRDTTRTITGIDTSVSFPTAEDKAAWRRAGGPDLLGAANAKRSVNDYDDPMRLMIGDVPVPTADLLKLPVEVDALGAELRRRYEADKRRYPTTVSSFANYVWWTARDLLAGPITPGTKAALYRLLAAQPGVRSEGTVTDGLGRKGVAISLPGRRLKRDRLIIDAKTAELLACESYAGTIAVPLEAVVYKQAGWVGALGDRP